MAVDDKTGQLKDLLHHGFTKGYVLYDDIDALLPIGYQGGVQLDDILSEIARNGIPVLDEPGTDAATELKLDDEFPNENSRDLTPIQLYMREIPAARNLTREEELQLFKQIRASNGQNSQDAMTLFIEANLMLVVKTARRFNSDGYELLDLILEGNYGLMKAIEMFDCTRDYRFSTLAVWWVRQFIMRSRVRK